MGRVEHVGGGGVVEDDHLIDRSAELGEILHVVAPMVDTRFAEQSIPEHVPLVQEIRHWVSILEENVGIKRAQIYQCREKTWQGALFGTTREQQ